MQGSPAVLDTLNDLLVYELAARDQYFIHSRMLSEWGFEKIAARISHEMEDETGHADALIRRILMLGGKPVMVPAALTIGDDLPDLIAKDLAVEYKVINDLRGAIALCERERDFVTRDILMPMLKDTEEDHAHWLEQQLRLIKAVGLENYQQSQMS